MLYILFGQDDFSLRQSLEEIKGSIGDATLLAANTTEFGGQNLTLGELRAACETVPFLAEKRLVIVDGLLGRFEPEVRANRKRKTVKATGQKNDYEPMVACLSNLPDSTILVLTDGRVTSKNPLFRELSVHAEVQSFPVLSDARLRQWIQRRVTGQGGRISPQQVWLRRHGI